MSRQANGRSTIYQGKDGYWHGRVTVGLKDDGRVDRRHVMSRSKAVVVDKVAQLERDRDRGRVRKASERWTVETWLDHWLENIARPFVRESTYEGYRAAVRTHLIPGLGKHRLEKLRPEHLERLYVSMLKITTRRNTSMSPGRVHQVHRTMRTALNQAVRRGYITHNPALMAKTPALVDQEVVPFSVEEVQRLFLAAQHQRNGTRWVVALALGLRQGEALGLKWEDIDWERGLLAVRRSRTRPRWGHGCKPSCGHKYGATARNADHCDRMPTSPSQRQASDSCPSPRRSSICSEVTERCSWRSVDELLNSGATAAGSSLQRRARRSNPRTDWDRWKKLLKSAEVRDGRLHDARHTAATVLLLLGVHERAMMSILGWSSSSMVGRYAHVIAPIHHDVASRLNSFLWSDSDDYGNGEIGSA